MMANNISGITTLTGQLMTNMVRGYSAYEIAVQNGFEGTVEEWLASLVGESVEIEVVEDTDSSYILRFTVGDESVTTPNLRQDLNDLKSQIQNINTIVSNQVAQIINLQQADQALDARVTALEEGGGGGGGIDPSLVQRVTALEEGFQAMDERVGLVETKMDDIEPALQTMSTKVSDCETAVTEMRSTVDGFSSDITTMKNDIVDLKADSRTVSNRLTNLESSVANLNTTVTMFESRVSSVEEQIEEIEDSLGRLITAHNESTTAHEDIRNKLSELSDKFDTYIDSTAIDLDQLSEIVAYIKNIKAVEIVDELPSEEDADPNKIYILRSTVENNGEEVGG